MADKLDAEDLLDALRELGAEDLATERLESLLSLVEKADELHERFHWGRESETLESVELTRIEDGTVLVQLGVLAEISYITQKGDDPVTIYEHSFEEGMPILAATADGGRLVIVGGDYKVTRRGIVG